MVKLYAFYSVGGYKDMYLGTLSQESSSTYYLPLLSIMKKRNNPAEQDKIATLEKLQSVKIINKENDWGFPNECNMLFSHGGYTIIYKTLCNGKSCLAIRNLIGTMRDEEGRSTPFNMLFIAENIEDNYTLDKVAIYCKDHVQEINSILSPTIVYDAAVNGLRVDLQNIYNWIASLPDTIPLLHNTNRINYLIISDEQMIDIVIKEQNLSNMLIDVIFHDNGHLLQGSLKYVQTSSNTLISNVKKTIYQDDSNVDNPQVDSIINNIKQPNLEQVRNSIVNEEDDIVHTKELCTNNIESARDENTTARIPKDKSDRSLVVRTMVYFKRLFSDKSHKECIKIFSIRVPVEYVQWIVLGVAIISFIIGLIL